MRLTLPALLVLSLCACQIVYKLPTRQGNVIDQRDLDKLELGMTREQVKFVMGTPVANTPFYDDRWEYLGYYKPPRGKETVRHITVYFEDDKVVRMLGTEPLAGGTAVDSPDVDTVLKQDKKDRRQADRTEEEDVETGVVIHGN